VAATNTSATQQVADNSDTAADGNRHSSGSIESRGIDVIHDDDRHGKARSLFAVWAAPNLSVLNFTIGATLTLLLGLEIWQAVLVTFAASLLWIFPGIIAASGPAAGTSGSVIQRAIYGYRGNRVVVAFYGWFISGVFLALNWVASSFMGAELLRRWGVENQTLALVLVTVGVSAVTVAVAVYGHSLILRSYNYAAVLLFIVFLAVVTAIAPHIDWTHVQPEQLTGTPLWVSLTVGFALVASTPLSYSNSADMARYLPRSTRASSVVGATALGGAIPYFLFTCVGALMGSSVSATDVEVGIEFTLLDMLPTWLGPVFVLGIVGNTIALNGMTTYSASMALQSIGIPIRRTLSAVLVGVLGTALTLVLVLSSSLIDAVNLMLQFLLIISAPIMAVYAADIVMRRNRYSSTELFADDVNGAFWYTAGFGVPGLVAAGIGGVVTALFLSTDLWSGPFSLALGGVDLSVPLGMAASAALYVLTARRTVRRQTGDQP
jgi:NCS1 family nucleobase:cation symporter-1